MNPRDGSHKFDISTSILGFKIPLVSAGGKPSKPRAENEGASWTAVATASIAFLLVAVVLYSDFGKKRNRR